MRSFRRALVSTLVAGLAAGAAFAAAAQWGPAQKLDEVAGNHPDLNTASLDGCPIQSPDGLSLYMASNRPVGGAASTSGSRPGRRGRRLGARRRTSASR